VSVQFDHAAIEQHLTLLHDLARASGVKGKLVLFAVGENPQTGRKLGPLVDHFQIGDVKIMADVAAAYAQREHLNVYAPWAVFRSDLELRAKGDEKHVISTLALVADLDNDKDELPLSILPIDAPYVIESSPAIFSRSFRWRARLPMAKPRRWRSRSPTSSAATPAPRTSATSGGCPARSTGRTRRSSTAAGRRSRSRCASPNRSPGRW
jgi:hypothetical protein